MYCLNAPSVVIRQGSVMMLPSPLLALNSFHVLLEHLFGQDSARVCHDDNLTPPGIDHILSL